MRISGIYKITNNETGEFYVGSSKNIEKRWAQHKCPSIWKLYPKNKMYQEMERLGTDVFKFEVLEQCDNLFEREQYWIDVLKPTYNTLKAYNKKKHGTSGVYKITCTVTGDFYIGSSVNVKQRWSQHKSPSAWKHQSNNKMYQDMQKYGTQAFTFEILDEFPQELLKIKEQESIDTLHPTYNSCDAYNTEESELAKQKTYAESHQEEFRARKRAYAKAHREELKTYKKTYREAHKDEIKAKDKAYAEAHREELKAYGKAYRESHKEKIKAYMKAYRESHNEKLKAYMKAYREAHKE